MSWRQFAAAAVCMASFAAAPNWALDGRKPGSVLIYPIQRGNVFTVLSVTNTARESMNFLTLGGATGAHWQFLNVQEGPTPLTPYSCSISNRADFLTPADTTSFLVECRNGGDTEGYAVVSAQDPSYFKTEWSHNFLVGSEAVINLAGGVFVLNAIPFSSPQTRGSHTDNDDPGAGVGDGAGDSDGQIDFDSFEYEGIPDHLYGEFIGVPGSTLTLINLSGGSAFLASVMFDMWNDNERPLSVQLRFRCWFDEELESLSPSFTTPWLDDNTVDDELELDVDCDTDEDVETGWFRVRGLNYSSDVDSCLNPALLGAITAGPSAIANSGGGVNGGHLLWESAEKQVNGDFFKFGTDDPECPEDVDMPPNCDAGPDQVVVMLGMPVQVDGTNSFDSDGIIVSYSWAFTDPVATVPTAIAMHTYNSVGTFTATLTIVDDDGLEVMCTTTIRVNDPPVCDAGPNQLVEPGDLVQFDGSNSVDNDGSIVQYDWDYGDGSAEDIDVGATTSHLYPDAGVFTVTLTVTDNDGKESECMTVVTVNEAPVCMVSVAAQDLIVEPGEVFTVDGSASSDPDGTIDNYSWNFGDGTAIESGVPGTHSMRTHSYASPGTFTITLTITDDSGKDVSCTVVIRVNAPPLCDQAVPNPSSVDIGELVAFDGSGSSDADGTIVSYSWDFGDGTAVQAGVPGTHATRTHSFASSGTFTITLTVTDNDGKSISCTRTVDVNAPPVCFQKDPDPTPTNVGVLVQFDGSMSSDSDGSIVSFVWDFGEGAGNEFGLGQTPQHAFGDDGTYTVTLTVTDDDGSRLSCDTVVVILNQDPVCDQATPDPALPTIGESVAFDGSGSSDPDGTIVTYSWDFGDGSMVEAGRPGSHATRNHSYGMGGTFTCTLTVIDDDGGMSTCDQVLVINQEPLCDAGGRYAASLFIPVDFDGSASSDPDGSIVNYSWDFGDGSAVESGMPGSHAMRSHAYTDYGMFTVTLTVTDNDGATKMCTDDVEILPVSGALAFGGDDAEEHCIGSACGGYATSLFNWTLENSNNGMATTGGNGNGILAVGVQPTVPAGGGAFFSFADLALTSWIALLPDPGINVDIITDPVDLMNVDFNDYQLIYIPSFGGIAAKELVEQHVLGGIRQELLDVLAARSVELEEFVLRRGGSLLSFTQAEDDKFDPQIMNAYTWAPVPFISEPFRFVNVTLTNFATKAGGPLEGLVAAQVTHETWHNTFAPDPMAGLSGLEVLVIADEPMVQGKHAVIGGIPNPPVPSMRGGGHDLPNASDLPGTRRGSNQHRLVTGSR